MRMCRKILCLTILIMAFSCQQMPEDEIYMPDAEEPLDVQVRSAEGIDIIYPISLYAYANDGKLVASQQIADEGDNMSLLLSEGIYQIVAVSGLSSAYQLPENPSLDDFIVMSGDEGAKTPLMIGRADVNVNQNSNARVELILTHVVAELYVTLKNVPNDVAGVQMTLSPLYSSLSMNGQYSGTSQKVKVNCALSSNGVWETGPIYIFPGSGQKSLFLSVSIRRMAQKLLMAILTKGFPKQTNNLMS